MTQWERITVILLAACFLFLLHAHANNCGLQKPCPWDGQTAYLNAIEDTATGPTGRYSHSFTAKDGRTIEHIFYVSCK